MSHEEQPAVNPLALRGCGYLLVVLAIAVISCGISFWFLPTVLGAGVAVPVITVFGEPLAKGELTLFGWDITNTATALVLVDIIIVIMALVLNRAYQRNGGMIPKGFQNGFEVMFSYLYNQTKSIVGAVDARKVFPLIASLFLIVLVANWIKLVPGFESVGFLHCAEDEELVTMSGYPAHVGGADENEQVEDLPFIVSLKVEEPLDAGTPATEEGYHACKYKYFGEEGPDGKYKKDFEEHPEEADNLVIAPFFRGASTDLNFTLALAIVAMVAVQYFGTIKLGLSYYSKFVNLPAVGKVGKNPMGAMDFIVGLLEILSEVAKVISFTFRLFGVLFAGSILLIVATFLISLLVPGAVYGLELFIGIIQAYVFFILPLVLIKLAMTSHHGDDH